MVSIRLILQLLAAHFSTKMKVADPEHAPPAVPTLTKAVLGNITITKEEVLQQLKQVDPKKVLGPDNISPHILKRYATQLIMPLTIIFQRCLLFQQWPSQWKVVRACTIHIKSRCDPQNDYLSAAWDHSLDRDEETFVVALDITGAFDKVWYQGITTNHNSGDLR